MDIQVAQYVHLVAVNQLLLLHSPCAFLTLSLADITSLPGTIRPWFSLLEISQPMVTPNPELQATHFQSYAASSGTDSKPTTASVDSSVNQG